MTSEKQKQFSKRGISRSDIDKATEIKFSQEVNLMTQEINLGITVDQSEAIFKVVYKDKKAQRPNYFLASIFSLPIHF